MTLSPNYMTLDALLPTGSLEALEKFLDVRVCETKLFVLAKRHYMQAIKSKGV